MAKRIITKIGDIFCVPLDNGKLRFFQYNNYFVSSCSTSVVAVQPQVAVRAKAVALLGVGENICVKRLILYNKCLFPTI